MTRLLVECTYVFEHPNANSGIQRVVRNVIQQLPAKDAQRECIPVVMIDGALFEVKSLAPLKTPKINLTSLRVKLEQWANLFWLRHRTLERRRPFSESKFARRMLYVMCRLAAFACLSLPIRVLDRLLKGKPVPERCVPLQHRAGDQLVLLDSSWHANFFPLAEQLKRDGVGIVSVIYDLIPLTHPQFCDAGLVKVFNEWFDWIARTADGYVAISTTIRDQVRDEMLRRVGPQQVQQRWFDYFYLGSELDLSDARAEVDSGLLQMFKTPEPVFLMVSTIEPRKNHAYLLDAFERAWANGSTARLCIAGKIGWKCDALVERIREHPELNRRLFMFNTLSDRSLEHAYSHATALVFPSYVEGFGLPLVEAMQRGLPAMGSDIPVFREIGGDYMAYFDLAEPQSLTDLVTDMERSGVFPAALGLAQWRWLSWREASAQLVERIERNLDSSMREPEPELEFEQQRQQAESQHANCP
ncbi:MAG: glycosyltransferase family 1 protein [Pseudomonas prosekii]